jgi:adenosylcobyric acid synthase
MVSGTYLHGLMQDNDYRRSFLAGLDHTGSAYDYSATVEAALDELAAGLAAALDTERLFAAAS